MTFPKPCRAEFDRLAKDDPDYLIYWVEADVLEPAHLTFAAESLGSVPDALPTLLNLLKHASPVVCEGAMCGLYNLHHVIEEEIGRVGVTHPSAVVRNFAVKLWNRIE